MLLVAEYILLTKALFLHNYSYNTAREQELQHYEKDNIQGISVAVESKIGIPVISERELYNKALRIYKWRL